VEEGGVRAVLAVLALLAALSLVAWRQSRALEALAALDVVRRERVLAEAERAGLDSRIQFLESRGRVVPDARARLGMHLPDATEIVILAGDQL
jgi:cell division protein FtsL